MATVHKTKARAAIYLQGKQVADETTKSKTRRDRSQPADKSDVMIVEKGQEYYWWKLRNQEKQISLVPPKPSQLTQSEFLASAYEINEELANVRDNVSNADDVSSFVEDIKDRIEDLRDEQEEKKGNMPEGLQEGPTGELLQERYDACDSAVNELDGIDVEYSEPDDDELKQDIVNEGGVDATPTEEDEEEEDFDLDEWKKDRVTEDQLESKRDEHLGSWLDEICDEISAVSIEC